MTTPLNPDSVGEEPECELCLGCEEVEVENRITQDRETVACPRCMSQQFAEERPRLKADGLREALGEFNLNANGSFQSEGEEDTYKRIESRIAALSPLEPKP